MLTTDVIPFAQRRQNLSALRALREIAAAVHPNDASCRQTSTLVPRLAPVTSAVWCFIVATRPDTAEETSLGRDIRRRADHGVPHGLAELLLLAPKVPPLPTASE